MTHIGFICLKNTNPQISNCSIILLKMENLVNREKWGQYCSCKKIERKYHQSCSYHTIVKWFPHLHYGDGGPPP